MNGLPEKVKNELRYRKRLLKNQKYAQRHRDKKKAESEELRVLKESQQQQEQQRQQQQHLQQQQQLANVFLRHSGSTFMNN